MNRALFVVYVLLSVVIFMILNSEISGFKKTKSYIDIYYLPVYNQVIN